MSTKTHQILLPPKNLLKENTQNQGLNPFALSASTVYAKYKRSKCLAGDKGKARTKCSQTNNNKNEVSSCMWCWARWLGRPDEQGWVPASRNPPLRTGFSDAQKLVAGASKAGGKETILEVMDCIPGRIHTMRGAAASQIHWHPSRDPRETLNYTKKEINTRWKVIREQDSPRLKAWTYRRLTVKNGKRALPWSDLDVP